MIETTITKDDKDIGIKITDGETTIENYLNKKNQYDLYRCRTQARQQFREQKFQENHAADIGMVLGKVYQINYTDPNYPCNCKCHTNPFIMHCVPCCHDRSYQKLGYYRGFYTSKDIGPHYYFEDLKKYSRPRNKDIAVPVLNDSSIWHKGLVDPAYIILDKPTIKRKEYLRDQ